MTYRHRPGFAARFVLFALLAGCKHSTTGPGGKVTIGVTLDQSALSIVQGNSGSVQATVTLSGAITGGVTVSISGVPAGVSGAVSGYTTTGLTTRATVTITALASTLPGSYTITVRASGSGVSPDATTSLSLTITAIPPTPAYTLSLDQSALSLAQGANAPILVTLNRTNFTGPVTLTVEDLPSGATYSVGAFDASGVSATLTITIGAVVRPSPYTITVRGTSSLAARTATAVVTVTSNVRVDFSDCAAADKAVWLAYQNGTTGTWITVPAFSEVYRFTVTATTGAFAFVTSTATTSRVNIQMLSQAELTAGTLRPCVIPPAAGITVNGTFLHSYLNVAFAFFGGRSAFRPGDGPFQMTGVPPGTFDLFAYTGEDVGFIVRNLTPTNNGSFGTIDFEGANAFDALSEEHSHVGNASPNEMLSMSEGYYSGTGANACTRVPLNQVNNSGEFFDLFGVPTAKQLATDWYQVFIQGQVGVGPVRSFLESFHDFESRVASPFLLPTLAPVPAVTISTGGNSYKRLTWQETNLQAEYNATTTASYSNATAVVKSVTITVSAAYRGVLTFTVVTPDLSAAPGWQNSWAPAAADPVTWTFTVTGSTGTACTQGARQITTSSTGSK